MRRSWFSFEYYAVALTLLVVFLWVRVPGASLLLISSLCGMLNAYILARTLWKKNRGLLHSSIQTSELQAWLAAEVITLLFWKRGLPPDQAILFLCLNTSIFALCRGLTKSLTPRGHVYNL